VNHLRPAARKAALLTAVLLLVAACGGTDHPSIPASVGPRPSSPATVRVLEPMDGAALSGNSIHVGLELTGGTIVPQTTTDIRPDEGHVHLYVNGALFSMNYGLEQDVPVQPGAYAIKAEFVAADHAPFSPRVWSPEIVVTVE
jgi:hypothetical protein